MTGSDSDSDLLTSILIDPNGYMAFQFKFDSRIFLYSPNGSFTGSSLTTPQYSANICFDSKGRFIQFSKKQITIYN